MRDNFVYRSREGALEEKVANLTLETLGKLEGEALAEHAVAVVAKLEDSNGAVRQAAVETLGKQGAALAEHAVAVVAMLKDSDEYVRKAAVETLETLETLR